MKLDLEAQLEEFAAECAACAAKPGAPTLCAACLHNRATVGALIRERDALIDELAKTRRERDDAKAALQARFKTLDAQADALMACQLALDETRDALANARAAAHHVRAATCEESARVAVETPAYRVAAAIRALAPLQPSVVCVPVEALEKSKEALRTVYKWASEAMVPYDLWRHFLHADADGVVMIRAALAALTKVKP